MGDPRRLVVVTGLPGAGKTTVGMELAVVLGWRFLSLDLLKEALHDRRDGRLSGWELRLAAEVELVGVLREVGDAVVDLWAQPGRDDARVRVLLAGSGRHVCEVACRVPAETAVERYTARRRGGPHSAPDDPEVLERIRSAARVMAPLGAGPTVDVDTTGPVDAEGLAERVREALARG